MKNQYKIVLGLLAVGAVGTFIYLKHKKNKIDENNRAISDIQIDSMKQHNRVLDNGINMTDKQLQEEMAKANANLAKLKKLQQDKKSIL